jgi:hypothetical protein
MKTPTLTITKRKVRSNNLFEAHLNKSAIELLDSKKILFSYKNGVVKLRIPSGDNENAYKISMHKQTYKKKIYKSSAKFSPVIIDGADIEGKYAIVKHGQSFTLNRI